MLEPAGEAWDAEQGMPVQLRWMSADTERTDTTAGAESEGTRRHASSGDGRRCRRAGEASRRPEEIWLPHDSVESQQSATISGCDVIRSDHAGSPADQLEQVARCIHTKGNDFRHDSVKAACGAWSAPEDG